MPHFLPGKSPQDGLDRNLTDRFGTPYEPCLGVNTREQALAAVKSMRYPQLRGLEVLEPAGIRGAAPGLATWI